jgi:hypothetical protein
LSPSARRLTAGDRPFWHRPGGTRTPNRRFWRPVLYQLSYGPLTNIPLWLLPFANGQGQSRTADTAVFSRVLYHLSYLAPTFFLILPYKPNAAKGGVWAK